MRILLRIFMLIFSFCSLPIASLADEHPARSLSPSDIQSAVNAASPGDIVVLPSGTYSGFNETVYVPNGISMRGQGMDNTILINTSKEIVLFSWNDRDEPSSFKVSISDIKLIGIGNESTLDGGVRLIKGVKDFRIFNCFFKNFGSFGISIKGDSRGLIYSCQFVDCYTDRVGYGVAIYGNEIWDNPKPPLGTQDAVFVEDCYFWGCKHAVASTWGSHYVFRHNQVEGLKDNKFGVDAHGKQLGEPCGSSTYEIYDNTIIGSGLDSQTEDRKSVV